MLYVRAGNTMARYDFTTQRLFVPDALAPGARVTLNRDQAHYLTNVLRMKQGAPVLAFNGRDGEWLAHIAEAGKRAVTLEVQRATRPQEAGGDLHYLFAPLKRARLDYMVQKATEMGASLLRPVITARTNAGRVNTERLKANVIEAAEQCGILTVPPVEGPVRLDAMLAAWDGARRLIYCDEDAPLADPLEALRAVGPGPLAVLIGPEGGFDDAERALLRSNKSVTAISLGPRILRADTAAVAALALIQAAIGDWPG